MTDEADALAEALAFYAEPETYHAIFFTPDNPAGDFMGDFGPHDDPFYDRPMPGKLAREALRDAGRWQPGPMTEEEAQALLCARCGHWRHCHDDRGCQPEGTMSGCECTAFAPPEPAPEPEPGPRERVAEFLRQWAMDKQKTDLVYGVHFDPEGGMAELLASDLHALLAEKEDQ